jgi:hypothetical protein
MKKSILTNLMVIIFVMPSLFSQNENTGKSQIYSLSTDSIDKKNPILTAKFLINTGFYFPSKNFNISADGSSDNNEIDFDETFDLKKSETTFAFNFLWRFGEKWHGSVEYFGVSSQNSKIIDREIEWEDDVFSAGAEVAASIKLNMFRIFFGRIISTGEQHEFGAGLGTHTMDIKTSLAGEVYVDESNTNFERKSVGIVAPLPNIGFWYFYAPTEKWALTARIDWFGIKIDNFSGSLWNLAPGVKYQAFKNIGFGLNYRYLTTKVDIDKEKWHGGVNFDFHGPLFTVSANF